MRIEFKLSFCLIAVVAIVISCRSNAAYDEQGYTKYVNPFIGTQHEGHCFPGATAPMGMIQLSPESTCDYDKEYGMNHVVGYHYTDTLLYGFTHTHLNGVGCPSMSDVLLMPFCDGVKDSHIRASYNSGYDKDSEHAEPGYYRVYLTDSRVDVELTATSHAGYHRYRFENPDSAKLLVDLQYGVAWDSVYIHLNVVEASQSSDIRSLSGYRRPTVWIGRDQYYTLQFNRDITSIKELPLVASTEKAPRYEITFDMEGEDNLEVLFGLSTTSIEAAKANLAADINSFGSFDSVRMATRSQWNRLLSLAEVEGDYDKKVMFYTALYHMYIQPNNIADIDGKFRSAQGEVIDSRSGTFYSTLSLWDTYRATHPLYNILTPSLVPKINASIMDHYTYCSKADPKNLLNENRYLPRWALWGGETNTMIGNHAVPVLVDGWLKGLKPFGYSDDELFDAIWESLTKSHYRNHTALIDKYGYIPYDLSLSIVDDQKETVSRLLESAYDDYCGAILADKLSRVDEYKFLINRSKNYRNVYDSISGFMRGRSISGEFRSDVDVCQVVGEWGSKTDFTEGSAWHYLFHVQHDVEGMIDMMGGEDMFSQKLDTMFYSHSGFPYVKELVWNIFGTLGQYWHGNEPCHHVPYLYKFTDKGYKCDAIINYLVDNFSLNAPDGLKGNDDCGQMSAWYIFATMGFYPVNPCGGEFVIGAPQLPLVTLNLENGRKFTVRADSLSEENIFVKSVTLNGEPISHIITYEDIMAGGELLFVMTSRSDRCELEDFNVH